MWNILYTSFINYLIFNFTFYVTNALLFIIDYFNLFAKYKIQTKDHTEIINMYKNTIGCVMQNTFIYIIPVICLFSVYEINNIEEFSTNKCITDFIICRILLEILFYAAHRILHMKPFYKYIHKKHHEIHAPIGISSAYMTVSELYIGNILPLYLPLLIVNAHPITIKLWMVFTTINTILFAHSGFKFLASAHDYHHLNHNKNYGTDLFMDRIFGTSY